MTAGTGNTTSKKSRLAWVTPVAAAGVLVLAACGSSSDTSSSTPSPSPTVVEWENVDPSKWGDLSPEFATCKTGKRQSPIDITGAVNADQPVPTFDYPRAQKSMIENNGHSIEVTAPGGSMTLGSEKYQLKQIHFHAPAENHIKGKEYPAEFHFVHKSDSGEIAVLGAFASVGKATSAWDFFLKHAAMPKGEEAEVDVNWMGLLPDVSTTYQFEGSLTTPPCTEGVKWVVSSTPLAFSQAQLTELTAAYGDNDRPIQPTNGRKIAKVSK